MLLHTLVELLTAPEQGEGAITGATVGLNTATRLLEARIDAARRQEPPLTAPPPRFLFVCVGDVDATALVAHLPMLVASYNAVCAPREEHVPLVLVPLAAGAELMLSTALQVRRASVLLLDMRAQGLETLEARTRHALGDRAFSRGFRASWLDQSAATATATLRAPHVKHLVTSTPKNLGEAKAAKKASRKAHKAARKARQGAPSSHS